MYYVPELYNKHSYLSPLSQIHLDAIKDECLFREVSPFDEDIVHLKIIMKDNDFALPTSNKECVELYYELRSKTMVLLDM